MPPRPVSRVRLLFVVCQSYNRPARCVCHEPEKAHEPKGGPVRLHQARSNPPDRQTDGGLGGIRDAARASDGGGLRVRGGGLAGMGWAGLEQCPVWVSRGRQGFSLPGFCEAGLAVVVIGWACAEGGCDGWEGWMKS